VSPVVHHWRYGQIMPTAAGNLPQPVLRPLPGQDLFEFAADYSIDLPEAGKLVVREGFTTDGASIPRLLWPVIGSPFDPDYIAPCAGVHDPLYAAELFPRPKCDELMRLLMRVNTPRSARRSRLFWSAVRVGGWRTWQRHTPKSIAASRKFVSLVRS
jgi:hypothetical protein